MRELIASVKQHEGFRSRAYKDSVGVWTIGYGTNLQVLEVQEPLASRWLTEALTECLRAVHRECDERNIMLSEQREYVLAEMMYNLGVAGCLGFRKMWAAVERGNFNEAAAEMLNSKWASQVGVRADRLAQRMRLNTYD